MNSRRAVFDEVARRLGAELVAYDRLTGGSSADVWRLDITDGSGSQSVVYRHHEPGELKDHGGGVAHKEFHLLERLHEHTFPVPKPLLVDAAERMLVTEFVVGDSSVTSTGLPDAVEQMVELLVRLHSFDVTLLDHDLVPALEDPIERLPDVLPETEACRRLRDALEGGAIERRTGRTALVHGDYWPGNLLWHDGHIAALIDWEDACIGDPLADLACARLELLCAYGDEATARFTHDYGERVGGLDVRSLGVWDAYVAATALASMHLWGLDEAAEADRRTATNRFLEPAVADLLA